MPGINVLFIWRTDFDGSDVVPSNELYRMLYQCGAHTCLAISSDGLTFERPELHEVDFEGSTANNILAHGLSEPAATGVFIDSNPACPASERFKALGGDMGWYDPDTLQPLGSGEAGKRQQALDAWPDNNRGEFTGPKAVIWGR